MARTDKVKGENRGLALKRGSWWFSRMIQGKRSWVNLETADLADARKKRDVLLSMPRFSARDQMVTMTEKFLGEMLADGIYSRDSFESRGYILGELCRYL